MGIKKIIIPLCCMLISGVLKAQFLMDMVDTTTNTGKGLLSIYKNFDGFRISGYVQPQFQLAQEKGTSSFEGGNFAAEVSNRFMLRRSRVRIDYVHFGQGKKPGVQVVFQFDANERGFTVRDIWGRITENQWQLFSFTTGIFARPFGYEVNLSSSERESPERGRMSQLLMKSERDIGAMLSFDVRKETHPLKKIKFDLGFFNGQGIAVKSDFDNHKDLVARLSLKPVSLSSKIILSASASTLQGGLLNNTPYVFTTLMQNGEWKQAIDSGTQNKGSYSPRKYYGADVQLKFKNKKGFTQLRAEMLQGTQSGTAISSLTPEELQSGTNGFYQRRFRGGYFYFIQNLGSVKHQLVLKYDFYDPNTRVSGKEIGWPGAGFTQADIKYSTLGFGYNYYFSENVKLMLYYASVKNESSSLPGFTRDVSDNVLTTRLQFKF